MKIRLAGLTVADFLHRHWQKSPLLARGALPGFADFMQRDRLFDLAGRDDLESRLVIRDGRRWTVRQGPFSRRALSRLRDRKWTLLVHGVNDVVPAARRLLQEFDFIPYARLDDVMVSYAPPGGGVGAHFDSYDVFLVQGAGERRWRIGRCRDLSLRPDAPLSILRRFRPTRSFTLAPGDLLYLPPRYAHEGVAVTDCITCSIGFRAPGAQELATRFLEFMQERLRLEGLYEDPDLELQRRPAAIGNAMVRKVGRMLERVRWDGADVEEFLGRHLTEPKAHVTFSRPRAPLSPRAFSRAAATAGLRLALATRMLFRGDTVFINGEASALGGRAAAVLTRLADRRALPPGSRPGREGTDVLYGWYRAGYIVLSDE